MVMIHLPFENGFRSDELPPPFSTGLGRPLLPDEADFFAADGFPIGQPAPSLLLFDTISPVNIVLVPSA
jgi:hypothetical protein